MSPRNRWLCGKGITSWVYFGASCKSFSGSANIYAPKFQLAGSCAQMCVAISASFFPASKYERRDPVQRDFQSTFFPARPLGGLVGGAKRKWTKSLPRGFRSRPFNLNLRLGSRFCASSVLLVSPKSNNLARQSLVLQKILNRRNYVESLIQLRPFINARSPITWENLKHPLLFVIAT